MAFLSALDSWTELGVLGIIGRALTTALLLYWLSFGYCFLRNLYNGSKTGMPSLIIPWDQNSYFWMTCSVPLRPYINKYAPAWIRDRLSLTIYCQEFLERKRPWDDISRKHGKRVDTMQYITCGRFEVWSREPEFAVELTRRVDDFRQFELASLFIGVFGKNVLSEDGAVWARHRKVVASVINERISKSVFQESLKHTDGLMKEVLSHSGGVTTKLFDMMKKITIHVLSGAGMGVSPNWDDDTVHEQPKPGFKTTFSGGMKVITEAMAGPIILPIWLTTNWPSSWPGAAFLHKLGISMAEFPRHTNAMLASERTRLETTGESQKANILSQLAAANSQAEAKASLSDDELVGNLFVFTAAGFDTTANTLSYALALLARYPQWQPWLLEEVDAIAAAHPTEAEWEYAAIFPKLTRLLAFMFETLRLFTPVLHIVKTTRTPQHVKLSNGNEYWIPADTTVYINSILLHLLPHVWRDLNIDSSATAAPEAGPSPFEEQDGPGDESKFRPSRWINPDGTLFTPPKGTFLPWSTGPRVCPGMKFAQVEFSTILLRLLRSCRVEAEPLVVGGEGVGEMDGKGRRETREEVERRLDGRLRDSMSLLALQMNGIYNVDEEKGEGLKLRLVRR